ncbi:MAG: hypothetical protein IJS39_03125 [Synergistaceae bacterium]|nr:hypothetical protein [Synergistaceae bacterium]
MLIGGAASPETLAALKAQTGGNAFIILDYASHALFWDMVSSGWFCKILASQLSTGQAALIHHVHIHSRSCRCPEKVINIFQGVAKNPYTE